MHLSYGTLLGLWFWLNYCYRCQENVAWRPKVDLILIIFYHMLLQNNDSHENKIVRFQVGIFNFSSIHQQISGTYCFNIWKKWPNPSYKLPAMLDRGWGGRASARQSGKRKYRVRLCFRKRSHIRLWGVCRGWDSCLRSEERVFPGPLGSVMLCVYL